MNKFNSKYLSLIHKELENKNLPDKVRRELKKLYKNIQRGRIHLSEEFSHEDSYREFLKFHGFKWKKVESKSFIFKIEGDLTHYFNYHRRLIEGATLSSLLNGTYDEKFKIYEYRLDYEQ